MNTFGIDITLMQGVIVEQQITNFILENEYEKELGIVTEADEGKLKAAGEWIGKQVDRFIGLLKTWWGKIVHFVTKTIPKVVGGALKWLRGIFTRRQKAEKVDASKIDDSNKEKVKEACNQANAANIKESTSNDEAVKELQGRMKEFAKTLGEREKENNEKPDEDNTPNTEKIEKIKEVKQHAVNTLNTIKENSDKPEEKAEIEKTINNIEQGKVVELSSENLDYLEGNLIDLNLVNDFYSFWCGKMTQICNITTQEILGLRRMIKNRNKESFKLSRADKYEYINDELKVDIPEIKKEYTSYTNEKEKKNLKLATIEKSKSKRKIKKSDVEKNISEFEKDQKFTTDKAKDVKETIEISIGFFKDAKSDKDINQKGLHSAINFCNFFMKECSLMYNDANRLYSIAISDLGNFLTVAKPCSGN